MSVAPVVTLATQRSTPVVRNRVLCVLVLAALVAALGLAFVSVAPNRLVSGTGVLGSVVMPERASYTSSPGSWLAFTI